MTTRDITLSSEAETIAFAARFAECAAGGQCILLQGQIGAGKTFFARALIQSLLGADQEVPSPTFTLVQTYEAPGFDIWHCDLYRLENSDHADELGLDQAFATGLCLIEWPDRLGSATPPNALTLEFRVDPKSDHRHVTLTNTSPSWDTLLDNNL